MQPQHEQERQKHKKALEKLADYMAGFFSNLAVVGAGLAIFKAEDAASSLVVAFGALCLGALITYFAKR